MSHFFRILIAALLLSIPGLQIFAQSNTGSNSWQVQRKALQSIIENQGQFQPRNTSLNISPVLYGFDGAQEDVFFTKTGIIIELTHQEKRKKSEEEKAARTAKKAVGFKDAADFRNFEEVGHTLKIEKEELFLNWINANQNVQIVVEDKDNFTHSYSFYKGNEIVNEHSLSSWKKLTYKNLYDNIDVVYEIHPVSGFKYSLIVHPGADVSKVKLKYSNNVKVNSDGSLSTETKFGNMTDHAPLTFYANNKNSIIQSYYQVTGNVISFGLGNYNRNQTIVIDPWTQMPNFPNSNWDCVWECERDGAGNVYIIGGTSPLQLIKCDPSTGLPIWVYNTTYDTTEWLGTFAVDLAGNSYVANGSPARIMKINTAGVQVWNNNNPGGLLTLTEFWNITFNCDQTKLVIAGTDGNAFGGPEPWIFDINMNSGNVIASVKIHEGTGLNPTNLQEVRSIAACNNSKYYFLTHDSIGWIHQSLTSCTNNGNSIFHINSGLDLSYKCENWRYNNAGLMALAHYNGFIFVHRGNQLQKRNFSNGAIVATVAIPGGSYTSGFGGSTVGCSGIDIDSCGNIYVGSTNGVYKFDQSLASLATYGTTFNVYDVEVNSLGQVIAAGSTGTSSSGTRTGYIQSFGASACLPQAIVCCDATICPISSLCSSVAPVTISPLVPGGTFSASCGSCITSGGLFNPTTAGIGTHTITYTLACGSESITITVNNCAPITACNNAGVWTASGGGPYSWYSWSPGGTTPITTQAQCLACGPYTWFFGTCLNGAFPVTSCTTPAGWVLIGTGSTITAPSVFPVQLVSASSVTLSIPSAASVNPCSSCPSLTVSPTAQVNASCSGAANGSFSIQAANGSGPYDYVLMNGATMVATFNNISGTQTFTGLGAGTYTLNVTDNNGCPGTATITITQPPALSATATPTNPLCNAVANGSITVAASGGTSAYTYNWGAGITSQNRTGLAAGVYTVTITDANSCSITRSATITAPSAINSSVTVTNASCAVAGSVNITVSGGTAGYTFIWSNGRTTEDNTGLSAGSYTVTITDANGCTSTNGPNAVTAAGTPSALLNSTTNISCNGGTNGVININVSGGTPGYTFNWSNGRTTEDITGLNAGAYSVTVTDNNGCTATQSATITGPSAITVTNSSVNVLCNGNATGSVNLTSSGGTTGYTFIWSNGRTTEDISGIAAGTYNVTVTDANGCTSSSSATITQPAVLSSSTLSITDATCSVPGAVNISVSGGTAGYTFIWSNGRTTEDITGISGGSYTVTITDANACTISNGPNAVNAVGVPLVSINSSNNLSCNAANNGAVNISVSNGSPAYTFVWSNASTTEDISGLAAGTYTVTVSDNLGCTATFSTTISEPAAISITVGTITNVSCSALGGITMLVSGGTAGYTYLWSNAATTLNISGLSAGNYQLTVTDSNGCTAVSSVQTVAPATPGTANINPVATLCQNSGSVTLSVTGTQGGTWSGSGVNASGVFSTATTGNFNIIYTVTGNCAVADTISISVAANDQANVNAASFCLAQAVSQLSFMGTTGGTWSGNGITNASNGTFDPATAGVGTHQVIYQTAGICPVSDTVQIIVFANATADISEDSFCTYEGPIALNVSGISGGVWSGLGITDTINGTFDPNAVGPGQHTVYYQTNGACAVSDSAVITVDFNLNVNPGVMPSMATDTTVTWGEAFVLNGGNDQTALGVNYIWTVTGPSPANMGNPNAFSTNSLPDDDGFYVYLLTATSQLGCIDTASVRVNVVAEFSVPLIPTAFSPNGDANNDDFHVVNLNVRWLKEFKVYNRWGQLLYDNATQGVWDGKYNGVDQPRDVYIYIISWQFLNDAEPTVKRGNLTLLR
jgi:gliding motility-associated-like protein